MSLARFSVPIFLLLAFGAATTRVGAQTRTTPVPRAVGATVRLEVITAAGTKTGSGFYIDSTGLILTAAHVIRGASSVYAIDSAGIRSPVDGWVYVDSVIDLAAVRTSRTGVPFLELETSPMRSGDKLYVVGSPLGLEFSVSDGIVSARRVLEGTNFLQISAPVSPGSSGGAVINESGRAVGIVVSGIRGGGAENLNFALSSESVYPLLPILRGRSVIRFGPPALVINESNVLDLNPVNRNLDFNWSVLDGVQVTHTQSLSNGVGRKDWVRYQMSQDAAGRTTIERSQTIFLARGFDGVFAERQLRAVLYVDSTRDFETHVADTKLPNGVVAVKYSGFARAGELRQQGQGVKSIVQKIPLGAFPSDFQGTTVAAISRLPTTAMFVQFLVADSAQVSLAPVKYEFGEVQTKSVAFGNDQTKCSPQGTPRYRKVEVRKLSITSGAVVSETEVLATPPYINVTGAICVYLPPKR
jgi:S1-C subfamily serine protease